MSLLDPHRLHRFSDATLLMLRLLTGAFLVYSTQDNVFDAARMEEFVIFLREHGFVWPQFMAPLSVYVQFCGGILLVLGLFTRWAGLIIALNFVVAVWMVHWEQDLRGWWPAVVLVFIGLDVAARGAGRYSLDAMLRSRRGPAARTAASS